MLGVYLAVEVVKHLADAAPEETTGAFLGSYGNETISPVDIRVVAEVDEGLRLGVEYEQVLLSDAIAVKVDAMDTVYQDVGAMLALLSVDAFDRVLQSRAEVLQSGLLALEDARHILPAPLFLGH